MTEGPRPAIPTYPPGSARRSLSAVTGDAPGTTRGYTQHATALKAGLGQTDMRPGPPRRPRRHCWRSWTSERPPLRVRFGAQAHHVVTGVYERRLQTRQDGAELTRLSYGG